VPRCPTRSTGPSPTSRCRSPTSPCPPSRPTWCVRSTTRACARRDPLAELNRSFLPLNADRYRTASGSERFSDVPTELDGLAFDVRGSPEHSEGKLLLVVISRLDDGFGTRRMYERLAESGVDTHVYGVLDGPGAVRGLDTTVHAGDRAEHRDSWVVLFAPDEGPGHAALAAVETGDSRWTGTRTFDPEPVERMRACLEQRV
jgi:hypothetical protein